MTRMRNGDLESLSIMNCDANARQTRCSEIRASRYMRIVATKAISNSDNIKQTFSEQAEMVDPLEGVLELAQPWFLRFRTSQ